MLQTVDVGERSLKAYHGVAPEPILDELVRHAEGLRGARVLHVNATAYGGGVSELLRSIVPLLNDLGLVADWQVIGGDDEFFNATKAMHNALQGAVSAPWRALCIALVALKNSSSPPITCQSATSPRSFSNGTIERSSSETPPP